MKKYSGRKIHFIYENHEISFYVTRPNKGGHTHNHTYNAAYTAAFGRHSLRRIPRDKKKEWVRIWEASFYFSGTGTLIHEIRTSAKTLYN